MTRRIRIDDEALDELVEAARWYEDRERGRGVLFSNAAFARVEALSSSRTPVFRCTASAAPSLPAKFGCCATPIWSCTPSLTMRFEWLRLPMNDNCPATGPIDSSRSPRHARAAASEEWRVPVGRWHTANGSLSRRGSLFEDAP